MIAYSRDDVTYLVEIDLIRDAHLVEITTRLLPLPWQLYHKVRQR